MNDDPDRRHEDEATDEGFRDTAEERAYERARDPDEAGSGESGDADVEDRDA